MDYNNNIYEILNAFGEFDYLISITHESPVGGVPYKFPYKIIGNNTSNPEEIYTEEIVCMEQDGTFSNKNGEKVYLKEVLIDAETQYFADNEEDFLILLNKRLRKDKVNQEDNEHQNSSIKFFINDLVTAKSKIKELRDKHGDIINVSKKVSVINKLIKFLENHLMESNQSTKGKKELTNIETKTNSSPILKWHGNKIALIELTKALIENGNLKGTQKEIFKNVEQIFGIQLGNYSKAISSFQTSRNYGNETKFLDTLKETLKNYIENQIEKKDR